VKGVGSPSPLGIPKQKGDEEKQKWLRRKLTKDHPKTNATRLRMMCRFGRGWTD